MFDMKKRITDWRNQLQVQGGMTTDDIDELESHLIDQAAELKATGLSDEEAFIISTRRIGRGPALSKEFSKVNADRLWKNLLSEENSAEDKTERSRKIIIVTVLAAISGIFARIIISIFGYLPLSAEAIEYWKFGGVLVIPFVGAFIASQRPIRKRATAWAILAVSVFSVSAIAFPFSRGGNTQILFTLFSPVVLWFTLMPLYANESREVEDRMNFVQFTGELLIYTVLLYCGGLVLISLTLLVFSSLGFSFENQVLLNIGIVGVFAAPVVSAFLVEEKKSVVENLAPILARIFSPMFLVLLVFFVAAMAVSGKSPFVNREFLLGFEALLVLVLAMVMYVISARSYKEKPGVFDYLNACLIVVAMVVDLVVLIAVIYRSIEGGLTPNRLMVIGLNILFLVHFIGIVTSYFRYIVGKAQFSVVEKWLTALLPAYMVWAGIISLIFPPLFSWA